MNKSLERELNWLYDLAYNVVGDANKEDTDNAYKTIKESLERLEKLEKVVEILKSKEVFEFKDDNSLYLNAEDHNWWGDIIEDSFVRLSEEENDLLKEVFGEWKNT